MTDRDIRVLLVEDTPDNRHLMELVLVRDGFDVTSVATAAAARQALSDQDFDVIALDIRLPDIDGLEFARELKADLTHRDTVIIAVTAMAMRDDREAALAAGCDDYIAKPIDTRALSDRIRAVVADARQEGADT